MPGAGNAMAYDRYAGMMNNPVRYVDPSGHSPAFPMIEGLWGSPSAFRVEPQIHGDIYTQAEWARFLSPSPKERLRNWIDENEQIHLVNMPEDSNQFVRRTDYLKKLGNGFSIAGFVFDIVETG